MTKPDIHAIEGLFCLKPKQGFGSQQRVLTSPLSEPPSFYLSHSPSCTLHSNPFCKLSCKSLDTAYKSRKTGLILGLQKIDQTLHYAKVVKTRFEVLNFDKLILHQFSTNMSQIFNDGVKTSKFLKK